MKKITIGVDKLIAYAETKRIAENLTKKEMCHVVSVNDNYYIACLMGRCKPSQGLINALKTYLSMPTQEVYFKVFAHRSSASFIKKKSENRFFEVEENQFKEKYNDVLKMDKNDYMTIVNQLSQLDVLEVPTA